LAGSDLLWRVRGAVDFLQQSAHFAKEQPPTHRVFRRHEPQEGFFKLLQ